MTIRLRSMCSIKNCNRFSEKFQKDRESRRLRWMTESSEFCSFAGKKERSKQASIEANQKATGHQLRCHERMHRLFVFFYPTILTHKRILNTAPWNSNEPPTAWLCPMKNWFYERFNQCNELSHNWKNTTHTNEKCKRRRCALLFCS